jgi:hypothetical protein
MRPSALPDAEVVAFDLEGSPMSVDLTAVEAPSLLVTPVVDALKAVSADRVVGSLDKSAVLAVVGFVLNREIVQRLGRGDYSPAGLVDTVAGLGYQWKTAPSAGA